MSTDTRPSRPSPPRSSERSSQDHPDQEQSQRRLKVEIEAIQNMPLEELRKFAAQIACERDDSQQKVIRAKRIQQVLREKVAALTTPENHSVIITRVSLNGQRLVEVAGPGGSRAEVAVHPEIDSEQLRVGCSGQLSRERNCLLKVTGPHAEWRDVGTFEHYLEDRRRALVKCHEQLTAVTLSDHLVDEEFRKGDLVGFDRDGSGLAYHRVPPPDRQHLFSTDMTDDDFDQLGGLKRTITQIKRCIDFNYKNPQVAQRYRLSSKRGILLCGPPGNGKTRLARCVSTYVSELMPGMTSRFMAVVGSSDYSVWLGQSEQNIVARFEAAREAAQDGPVVMFFDEIDAIAKRRGSDYGSGAPDRILNTFLGQLDGVRKLQNLVVIGATNRVDTLDPAVTRPGRFDVKIEIPRPSRVTAKAILLSYLEGLPLAEKHQGCSLEEVVAPILSCLFNPKGAYSELLRVRIRDGRFLTIPGRELVSGAVLERVVSSAAEEAAVREMETGTAGISDDDLALALDRELRSTACLISAGNVKSYVTSIPQEADPVSVTVTGEAMDPTFDRPI